MTNPIGVLTKTAGRIGSDNGLQSAAYPVSIATADAEEVVLGAYDLMPMKSESLTENVEKETYPSLIGAAGVVTDDIVAIKTAGDLELAGCYDGLDILFACALGAEHYNSPDWEVGTQKTEVDCALDSTGKIGTMNALNIVAGDNDKWIKWDTSGASYTNEGQVRHISSVDAGANTITFLDALSIKPADNQGIVIADEFKHLYECSNKMQMEDWDQLYAAYFTTGIGHTDDQILRWFTLGVEKHTSMWVFRAVYVNTLTFNYSIKSGLSITANLIAYDITRSSTTNTADTTWDWSKSDKMESINERIMGDDVVFQLADYVNTGFDSDQVGIAEFSLVINNNLVSDHQDSVSGLRIQSPVRSGHRTVTGTLKRNRYDSDANLTDFIGNSWKMLEAKFTGTSMGTATKQLNLYLPRVKLTAGGAPIGGPGSIPIDFSFSAFNGIEAVTGFPTATITTPYSQIMIETQNRNPFSAFRDQNQEY